MNNVQSSLTLAQTIDAYNAGLRIVTCVPAKGALAGVLSFALSDNGTSAKNRIAVPSPKPAPKPARVKKTAPKRVKKTASKPAKPTEPDADFAEVDDLLGDGGRPGIALVERVPSVRPSPRNPTPRKGEAFAAFASRIGRTWAEAKPIWRAHKDSRVEARFRAESARFVAALPKNRASKVVAVQQTAKPAPVRKWSEPTIPADADATRDVPAITNARRERKARMDAQVTSLSATVKANSSEIAAMRADLSAILAAVTN